ncbi:MAG: DUF933 domain-containing protein, partial [Candidatus Omnitrophica bacterium]|nr:DUF933 domain-containing protein [Candidatus Omnitrophota bacterium]
MKICIIGLEGISVGKHNVRDERLDQVDKLVKAKKKTYIQVELVDEGSALESDAIIVSSDSKTDLILKDLDFVETRLSKNPAEAETAVLGKLKNALEKEEFVANCSLSEEEKKEIAGYSLFTVRPVIVAEKQEVENLDALLSKALALAGYISFFTAGEKDTRAWLIKKGATAWEAAGAIHSDIQKGFIRAEIISFNDYIQA